MRLFKNLLFKMAGTKKERKESLLMDLINDPDNAEVTIRKEDDEIVIRIKKRSAEA